VCYRAVANRDRRYDSRFVAAVRTTGIYCRPSCPAPLPKPCNLIFFSAPSAAEAAGFRACRRCRPDAPSPIVTWPDTSRVVSRAVRMIAVGSASAMSAKQLSVRLGFSERHLRRLFLKHVGAPPHAVITARRMQRAVELLQDRRLRVIDVALASGFSSLRRFNDVFRSTFSMTPTSARSGRTPQWPGPSRPLTHLLAKSSSSQTRWASG
jgi:AraC family transcriptional regulator of adaptative response / DNA-3-methyladenine glycosylase II